MTSTRRLIVNADDFGQSEGINRGIVQAHDRGIVTSGSLMVRWPAAVAAAAWAREHPRFSVGLHLDFGEWAFRMGEWTPLYHVMDVDDLESVSREVGRQCQMFLELMGRPPTHVDSHQHVHMREPARAIVAERARALGVPLRGCSDTIRYCGSFYGQTGSGDPLLELIRVPALVALLRDLSPGTTELGCHPGFGVESNTMYAREREHEVETLSDPAVRSALDDFGIMLCSFSDVRETA